jgi:hypothetical protein
MRKYILGLVTLAVLGTGPVLGQTPQVIHGSPGTVETLPDRSPTVQGGVITEPAGACCDQAKIVCVPENYTKKTINFVYCSGCEPVCLCYFRGLFGCCGGCEGGHCEAPYTRRFLIVKIRPCEQCVTKCVPVQTPAGCAAPGGCTADAAMPVGTGAKLSGPMVNSQAH